MSRQLGYLHLSEVRLQDGRSEVLLGRESEAGRHLLRVSPSALTKAETQLQSH